MHLKDEQIIQVGRKDMAFFDKLPINDRSRVDFANVRGVQFSNRCSSSTAPVRVAAKRLTSSSSASCSATV